MRLKYQNQLNDASIVCNISYSRPFNVESLSMLDVHDELVTYLQCLLYVQDKKPVNQWIQSGYNLSLCL